MKTLAVAALALVLVACDADADRPEVKSTAALPQSPSTAIPQQSPVSTDRRFDKLTIELILESRSVSAGCKIRSEVVVRNETKKPVTDPSCRLSGVSFGLIPIDEPDAELWGQIVTDCGGPFVFRPGYKDRSAGPDFHATDKFGDPLAPGEYLAAMQIEGRSERITVPVQVTP